MPPGALDHSANGANASAEFPPHNKFIVPVQKQVMLGTQPINPAIIQPVTGQGYVGSVPFPQLQTPHLLMPSSNPIVQPSVNLAPNSILSQITPSQLISARTPLSAPNHHGFADPDQFVLKGQVLQHNPPYIAPVPHSHPHRSHHSHREGRHEVVKNQLLDQINVSGGAVRNDEMLVKRNQEDFNQGHQHIRDKARYHHRRPHNDGRNEGGRGHDNQRRHRPNPVFQTNRLFSDDENKESKKENSINEDDNKNDELDEESPKDLKEYLTRKFNRQ